MKFGISLASALDGLHYPPGLAEPAAMLRFASRAEQLGFDSLSVADILLATDYVFQHQNGRPSYYEPMTLLAAISQTTERIGLVVAVIAVPLHTPLVLARQAATVDALSGGRLTLGLGLGTSRASIQAADATYQMGKRGAQQEEMIQSLRALWQPEAASFHGQHYAFDRVLGHPAAARTEIPIYLGGNARATVERAGRLADGWMPFVSDEELADLIPQVQETARAAGRDPGAVSIAPQYCLAIGRTEDAAHEMVERSIFYHRFRVGGLSDWLNGASGIFERALVGTPASLRARIERLAALGVTELTGMIPMAASWDALDEQMEMFAQEVMPAFRSAS